LLLFYFASLQINEKDTYEKNDFAEVSKNLIKYKSENES